jgi:hypothetical protein
VITLTCLLCLFAAIISIVKRRTEFLGAFAKLLKAPLVFVISVSVSVPPSVRAEQLGSQGMDFHKT